MVASTPNLLVAVVCVILFIQKFKNTNNNGHRISEQLPGVAEGIGAEERLEGTDIFCSFTSQFAPRGPRLTTKLFLTR